MKNAIIHTFIFILGVITLPKASLLKRDAKNNYVVTLAYAHGQATSATKDIHKKSLDSALKLLTSTVGKISAPFNSE